MRSWMNDNLDESFDLDESLDLGTNNSMFKRTFIKVIERNPKFRKFVRTMGKNFEDNFKYDFNFSDGKPGINLEQDGRLLVGVYDKIIKKDVILYFSDSYKWLYDVYEIHSSKPRLVLKKIEEFLLLKEKDKLPKYFATMTLKQYMTNGLKLKVIKQNSDEFYYNSNHNQLGFHKESVQEAYERGFQNGFSMALDEKDFYL